MKPLGIHLIAEFLDCQKEILDNRETLEVLLKDALEQCGFHCETLISQQFEPIGVTVIAIISESHAAIHTYPEDKQASIDIFTCSADPHAPQKLLDYLQHAFQPQNIQTLSLQRSQTIEIHPYT